MNADTSGIPSPPNSSQDSSRPEIATHHTDAFDFTRNEAIERFKTSSVIYYEHSARVAALAGRLADRTCPVGGTGVTRDEIVLFYHHLGQYHDIGKYAIPFEILEKPGRLTAEETKVVRIHPELGEQMLSQNEDFEPLLPAVRHHHERWDGRGYPDGLAGEAIPLEARIISIVDAYDAIISDRPYRKGSSPQKALEEIRRCAGTQFDPSLANHFLSMMLEDLDVAV
jgi:HD-GYP domain-containing protein (c-di-GMP phosphodiesterase class II)